MEKRRSVVFKVETVGCDWEGLEGADRAHLTAKADGNESAARGRLARQPPTAEIVCIGLLDLSSDDHVQVHVRWPPNPPFPLVKRPGSVPDAMVAKQFGDLGTEMASIVGRPGQVVCWPEEAALLRAFWEDVAHYEQIISFNGRSFDAPMAMMRSMALGVEISRNLLPARYDEGHVDLVDRLSCFGAMRAWHPLDFWCRRFGLVPPLASVSHENIERMWRSGEIAALCRSIAGDLHAIVALDERYFNTVAGMRPIRPPFGNR